MFIMEDFVLSLNERNHIVFMLSNCPQVLTIVNDRPIKKYFVW